MKKSGFSRFTKEEELPQMSVLMAVYNEESVIERKMQTLLKSNYPLDKIRILVGSDNSSDDTNLIMKKLAIEYPQLAFFEFKKRSGKQGVINQLVDILFEISDAVSNHILVFTDANIMLEHDTLFNLARNFKEEDIGLVDTHMINTEASSVGIGKSEKTYISYEVKIKHWEGQLWGTLQGPFGGCFALRSNLFQKIPEQFLVDDFFLTTKVFEAGYKTVSDLEAKCYEKVPSEMKVEFKRKARISAGNYQNLANSTKLLWPPFSFLAFSFFSHKVIRWTGPLLMIVMVLSISVLAILGHGFFKVLFFLFIIVGLIIPLLDFSLERKNVHLGLLRNIRYFLLMNIALLKGFIRYVKGVKSGIWEPTKR